jgi:membrane-associated protein
MRSDAAPYSTPHPTPVIIGSAALATAATLAVITGVLSIPDPTGPLEEASRTLGSWAYPAVGAFAFLETGAFVGLLVPGETAVVVGGVVAAEGDVELIPLIGLVWLAAAGGDLVSFLLGRRLGRPFLERHGPRVRLGPERLGQVDRFYARHGGSAVLLGRFIGLVRAVSPFVAGASGLALRRFVPWSLAGTLAWAATFTLVGYGFSESFADSGDTAARIALGVALLAAVGYATVTVVRGRSGGLGHQPVTDKPQRGERAEGSERRPDEPAGDHVEREVHAQVHTRERHGRGDREDGWTKPRAQDGDGGRGGEGRGAVARGERGIARNRGKRAKSRIGHRRASSPKGPLQEVRDQRGGAGRRGRGGEGHGKAAAPQVGAEPQPHEQRTLDHHADSTTNTAVSNGCSKAGAASTSARSKSSNGDIAERESNVAGLPG